MKYLYLSYKNVSQNMWRSLTLGIFIFLSVVIFMLFNSFVETAVSSVNKGLIDSLLGDVQIRPFPVEYKDIIDMSADWGSKEYLTSEESREIQDVVSIRDDVNVHYGRVRTNVMIAASGQSRDTEITDAAASAIILGIDPNAKEYQNNLKMYDGRYLDGNGTGQIILSKSIAEQLEVEAGDFVMLQSSTINDEPVMEEVLVAGIGNAQKLAGFEGKLCYADLKTAQKLKGLGQNEYSEIILFTTSSKSAGKTAASLVGMLEDENSQYTITSWKEQGGYIGLINFAYSGIFYLLMFIVLLITGILIMNLVMMIGYERRQEIATMRSIGYSRFKIILIFICEIMLSAVFFAAVGVMAASIIGYLISGSKISISAPLNNLIGDTFQLDFNMINGLFGVLGIMIFTGLAAFYPSLKAASIHPADILDEK